MYPGSNTWHKPRQTNGSAKGYIPIGRKQPRIDVIIRDWRGNPRRCSPITAFFPVNHRIEMIRDDVEMQRQSVQLGRIERVEAVKQCERLGDARIEQARGCRFEKASRSARTIDLHENSITTNKATTLVLQRQL
jgi:hypothetical protein